MKLDLRSRTRRRVDELERLLRNEQRAGAQAAARIANLEREMSQTWELLAVFDDRGGEMKDTGRFFENLRMSLDHADKLRTARERWQERKQKRQGR